MMLVRDLRDSFIKFFKDRDHRIISSSSLVPKDDPTLLFTTAGMVQFKPVFAGTVNPGYTRAASIQKCLRTSDLENVGKTKRHCTYFEMLGNFSFGDYFKKEAIQYAWDYSTGVIGFPKENIWVSIYENDDEAFGLWKKNIGIPENRIVRLGRKDNFWGPAGDSGACGPCSELYLDRGAEFGCGRPDCKPGCECERFLEFWNLVFNQFYQDTNGNLNPLPKTGIDTGMGLERLATLVQNVDSIFGTDELGRLVKFICNERKVPYEGDNIIAVNVLVEHARALVFAISDGAYPSNEGRGYVLRRILRRALRFGRQIGINEPFLYKMVDPLVEIMGAYYPEIGKGAKNASGLLEGEERRFLMTLENGMDRLDEIMKGLKKTGNDTISGTDSFVLYDTFGFPPEMTVEIASEKNLRVDMKGFEIEMEKQRERGKQSWKSGEAGYEKLMETLAKDAGITEFQGYTKDVTDSEIIVLGNTEKKIKSLSAGEQGIIITKETSFYGESGGQVGDTGKIISAGGAVFNVLETRKLNKTIIHLGEVVSGKFETGERVRTEIDDIQRNLTRANHTATHLLQAALRKVLGTHVHQAGSLVEPGRLRFDFAHFKALTSEEIAEIEGIVNEEVWRSVPVKTEIKPLDEAVKMGAMAVFDEKYEDTVRVVSVPGFSMELCGGTHVDNTGKIGVFKILKEASPGAGMRRIEAVTLKGVLERFNAQNEIIRELAVRLNATESDMPKKLQDIIERERVLLKEVDKLKSQSLASGIDEIISKAIIIKNTKLISGKFNGYDVNALRKLSDEIRSREKDSIVCFGSALDGKALLMCSATSIAVSNGINCGDIIKQISPRVGGSGGGRKDMAQAGGKNPDGLNEALKDAVNVVKKMLG